LRGTYVPASGSVATVNIVNNRAYIALEEEGIQIIDVSNPDNPSFLGSYATTGWAEDIKAANGKAYVADSTDDLVILDVSNPAVPTLLGQYESEILFTRRIQINNNLVVLHGTGLEVVDVSDPSNPITQGSYETPGQAEDIRFINDIIYVADIYGGLQISRLLPGVNINYSSGAPGSYFTITGFNFPPNANRNVKVNNVSLGNINVDQYGKFTFLLSTATAEEGRYVLTIDGYSVIGTTAFNLDTNDPVRPQEGNGPIFNVPPGIAFTEFIFMPSISLR
jgi:hypothetical protein